MAVERFLSSLAGIRSARVVAMEPGTLDEIHVLCAPSLQPKQVVRNVESALCAGLGIRIDRRIVSVAQLRAEIETGPPVRAAAPAAGEAPSSERSADPPPSERAADTPPAPHGARGPAATAGPAAGAAGEPSRRFLFVGYDSSIQGGHTTCRVTIRRDREQFTGSGAGSNSARGRVAAAAEAVLNAVGEAAADSSLGLDGATITELGGRSYVLVSALGIERRENLRLTGVAALVRSPEEAAILAGLQAANRWSESR